MAINNKQHRFVTSGSFTPNAKLKTIFNTCTEQTDLENAPIDVQLSRTTVYITSDCSERTLFKYTDALENGNHSNYKDNVEYMQTFLHVKDGKEGWRFSTCTGPDG